jgi:hypothetical protein
MPERVKVQLKPSYQHFVLLFSLHLIAVMACLSAAYSLWLTLCVLLFILVHAVDACLCWRYPRVDRLHYEHGSWSLGLNPKAYRRWHVLTGRRCDSDVPASALAVDLLPSSWFSPYLGVLNYRSARELEPGSLLFRCLLRLCQPVYSVVLCEDSADIDELRHLRIAFRCG